MTISSETRIAGPFNGNDVTDTFPFTFKVFNTTDVLVTQADEDGVEAVLAIGLDMTVSINADQEASPGGSVVLTGPLPTGYKLSLTSIVPVLQPIALTNAGGFYPDVLNKGLDRATIQIQQLEEKMSRAAILPVTSGQSGAMFLEVVNLAVSNASDSAAAAAASESAASSSETNAAASESTASGAASTATTKAFEAAASAAAALASNNSAAISASTATTKAAEAVISANSASASAGTASSAAGAASGSASAASASASTASSAATTAQGWANNSAASAVLAASSAALSTNQGIDLRIGMDYIYGAGLWSQHSGTPGSGSDIGPALSHVLGLLGGRGDVIIPVGSWRMATPPSAALLSGRRIIGQGSQGSGIVYDANTGVAFFFSGTGGFTGGGIRGLSIHLESGYPSSTAQAIRLEGDATYQPDQMVFEDVYISALGASYWNAGFFAYGNVRISPQGIRVCTVKNMQVFRCNATGIYISNVVQFSAENIGVYVGTGGGANIYIAGGGSASTNSVQLYIRGAVATELNITNSSKFEISGTFATFATNTTATVGRVLGFSAVLSGTLGTNVTLSS